MGRGSVRSINLTSGVFSGACSVFHIDKNIFSDDKNVGGFSARSNLISHNRASVSDDEKITTLQPDASINIVHGVALDRRFGYGEAKSQYQALNHRLIGLDLVRIAHLAKIASDNAKGDMYTMCEDKRIQLALKFADIPLFIVQSSKITKTISSFEHVLNCGIHNYNHLTDHMFLEAIHSKTPRKRKFISSHYNH
ncbi:hypothetical protein RMATCC62417_12761 [Rhizopus microsporus]|nr:hypothetical protein RMATCC62417_12761 [Rhizopus microsporus]